ncbi:MAG TPA: hypothetical protein VFZ09_04600 [Archangium sp.]|uniref:hypothetical protein n=1 Tax=Archangium sp. TaxID=1872627 RepID=UPI002E363BEA|nr:hypothetical protein [Archangium sp.]HEX5745501.1 hypothetical protein [Archangium sp.]
MEAVDRIRLQLLLPGSPWEWKQKLLDVMEQGPLGAPTHWGEAEGLRKPYQRETLVRFGDGARRGDDSPVPVLMRTTPPRYNASWSMSDSVPGWLCIDSRMRLRPEDPCLFFELAKRLATVLPVEYGLVDIQFQEAASELLLKEGNLQHPRGYVRWGPDTLFARTFFGPRLVRLMGEASLWGCGAVVHRLDNGAVMLDLLQEPWLQGAAVLKQRQQQVFSQLVRTGIFSRSEAGWTKPGERWVPPSGAEP